MSRLWVVGAVLFVVGCTSARIKPIEVDVPMAQKHFIVMGDAGPTLR